MLLSDGAQTRGTADPVQIAAQAGKANVPIYAVALGTPQGLLRTRTGALVPVPPDTVTLREVARDSRGRVFRAADAAQLADIFRNLGTRLAVRKEKREITGAFAGGALLIGAVVSLLRTGRLP